MARSKVLVEVGALLKKWRQENDLSQEAAAKKIGASQSSWGAWESGKKAPDNFNAAQLEELTEKLVPAKLWAIPRRTSVSLNHRH